MVAGLGGVGERGVAAGFRGAGSGAGTGDGGVGSLADLGGLSVSAFAGGLRAGVGVGAGLVGGLQRGLRVVPGGVHRRGGCRGGLGGLVGPGEGDSGFGLGLAAASVSSGQRRGDPAGVGGGQLGSGGADQAGGTPGRCRSAGPGCGILLAGGGGECGEQPMVLLAFGIEMLLSTNGTGTFGGGKLL